jgi:hypothetical protein
VIQLGTARELHERCLAGQGFCRPLALGPCRQFRLPGPLKRLLGDGDDAFLQGCFNSIRFVLAVGGLKVNGARPGNGEDDRGSVGVHLVDDAGRDLVVDPAAGGASCGKCEQHKGDRKMAHDNLPLNYRTIRTLS